MTPTDRSRLFEQAFDTFKAFDGLTVASSSLEQQVFPASVWQILQHLLAWQEHQLYQLRGAALTASFYEKRSWESGCVPPSQEALQAAVTRFKQQLNVLQTYVDQTVTEMHEVVEQGLILQAVALHLSFHLGEVVLIRRLQGSYPLPDQMQEFLRE